MPHATVMARPCSMLVLDMPAGRTGSQSISNHSRRSMSRLRRCDGRVGLQSVRRSCKQRRLAWV